MRSVVFLAMLFWLASVPGFAGNGGDQEEEMVYTMMQDIRISNVQDIGGRLIVPEKYERGYSGPMEIDPGEMVIRINAFDVNFWGMEELSYFTILSTTRSKVGYVMELMSARGHRARMKAVLDENKFLRLLYFNSETYGEHTFFLASKTSKQLRTEAASFSSVDFKRIKNIEDLFGETVRPYAYFNQGEDPALPNFLSPKDSILFTFDNDTLISKEHVREVKKIKPTRKPTINRPGVTEVYQFVFKKGGDPLLLYLDRRGQIALIEYERRFYLLRP